MKKSKRKVGFMLSMAAFFTLSLFSISAFGCTSVLAGKGATTDGSVMVSRNEDSRTAWSKRFIVHKAESSNSDIIFKSTGNKFEYSLGKSTFKYTATPEWDPSDGQFEEDGINEYQVAVSATESVDNNEKAAAADPFITDGITECSIPSVILPKVKTAKEGVELLGSIVEKKGSGEGFGVSIADKNEAWYIECGSGHEWAAVRVPDDSCMVVANQIRIGEIDLSDSDNYLGNKDIVQFAKSKGLYDENQGAFSFAKAFGTDTDDDMVYNYPRVWWGEKLLKPSSDLKYGQKDYPLFVKPDKKITPQDIMAVLRSHYDGTDYDTNGNKYDALHPRPINVYTTMESHILQLRGNLPNPVGGVHWLALGVPEESVYVRFYSGITDTPADYKLGTDKYDEKSAYWNYRSLGALTCTYYSKYAKDVITSIKDFEDKEAKEAGKTDNEAAQLYTKSPAKCAEYLTQYSNGLAKSAGDMARELKSNIITQLTKETRSN